MKEASELIGVERIGSRQKAKALKQLKKKWFSDNSIKNLGGKSLR